MVHPTGASVLTTAPSRRPALIRDDRRDALRAQITSVAKVTLIAFPVALGVIVRAWFILRTPIVSDFAVPGLMANAFLHGHFNAFYWGQDYGGVEPFLIAAAFVVLGHTTFAVALVPAVLSAVAAVLVWRVARRLVRDRYLAALAGALAFGAPETAMWVDTHEYGFRGVTLVAGLAALLLALRVADGEHRYRDVVGLGLAAGIGWWASPEIVYLGLAAALVFIGTVLSSLRRHPWAHWPPRLLALLGALGLAASPWLWANVSSGFRSVQSGNFPQPPHAPSFSGRLSLAFAHSFPVGLGIQEVGSGTWLFGHSWSVLLWVCGLVVLALCTLLALSRPGRCTAIGAALVAFPFLYAASPATWYWQDGRYALYLPTLLALLLVIGCARAPALWHLVDRLVPRRRRPRPAHSPIAPLVTPRDAWYRFLRDPAICSTGRGAGPVRTEVGTSRASSGTSTAGRALMGGLVAVLTLVSVLAFSAQYRQQADGASFFSNWLCNPNGATVAAASALERGGVRYGYADYWVAYKLDFLTHGALTISPVPGHDVVRSAQLAREVAHAHRVAWLFVPPAEMAEGIGQFGGGPLIKGPMGLPESRLVFYLSVLHIPYRVVRAGVLQAVIPGKTVLPRQVLAST